MTGRADERCRHCRQPIKPHGLSISGYCHVKFGLIACLDSSRGTFAEPRESADGGDAA